MTTNPNNIVNSTQGNCPAVLSRNSKLMRFFVLRLISLILVCSLLTLGVTPALGQEARKDGPDKNPIVTASVTTDGVRISAPSAVVQLRLEVYDDAGQKLLDTEQRGGNVLDWHLQGSAGERVADGTYLCVVTVKDPSGRQSQKLGLVSVNAQSATLRSSGVAELSPGQAQVLGPIEGEDVGLAVVPAEDAQPVTVLANTGDEAQLTRSRGPLSFRLGDFFSANDREQMRLTEEGNLGIGTTRPKAKLDVAGMIRAREGFLFSNGSALNVNDRGALSLTNSDGSVTPNVVGSGTPNRITKWADNAGTLGDSVITEASGNVGLGVASPGDLLDVAGPPNAAGRTGIHVRTTAATGNSTLYFDNDRGNFSAYGGLLTGGSANTSPFFGVTRADKTFLIADGPSSLGLGIGTLVPKPVLFGTANAERMRIDGSGNVGIGTTNPSAKLEVAGNVKLSGAGSSLVFPDGTSMTTAAGGGGSMSGTNIVNAVNDLATAGTINDTRLSSNVARLNSANTFAASQSVNGNVTASGVITANGRVESNSGGFKFPDGTVQTTAVSNSGVGKTYTTSLANEIEITRSGAQVVGLNLPAGTYLLNVTLEFENRANEVFADNTRKLNCYWGNPFGASENAYFRLGGQGSVMDHLPISVHTITNRPVDSGLWFYCYAQYGGDRSYVYIKRGRLTAIRLGDVVTQP